MNHLKEIVSAYGIDPFTAETITDTTFLIKTRNEKYGLKKSSLSKELISKWENVYHEAYRKNINGILPVYRTRNGKLFVESNQSIYYLTPWIHKNEMSIKKFYRCIGNIHHKSKQSFTLNKKDINQSFKAYKKHCEGLQVTLLNKIKVYEARRFMSPFELQICTHYRDIRLVLHKTKRRLEQFMDNDNDVNWSYSLCHNNLKFSNIFNSNETWINNWEKATYDHAIFDLVNLFENEVIYYDAPTEEFIKTFHFYMKKNKLSSSELLLLTIYLLDPTSYLNIMDTYDHKQSSDTMVNFVKELQATYRILLFGLDFTNYIEKEFESITLDDLEI